MHLNNTLFDLKHLQYSIYIHTQFRECLLGSAEAHSGSIWSGECWGSEYGVSSSD